MPPAAAPSLPAQVNPALMQALQQRAAGATQVPAGAPGAAGPMPNSMNAPVPQTPPAPAPGVNMARPGGAGTPPQQMMKAAAQAQSPMQDPETRASAKDLIMKLMKHM